MIKKIKQLSVSNKIILLIIFVFIVILTTVLSYSYIAPIVGERSNVPIDVSGSGIESLYFEQGSDISIVATPENFDVVGENLSGSTWVTATALANKSGNPFITSYSLYLSIDVNDYEYSNGLTPELILTVNGPDGEITDLPGLTHTTQQGVSGFDITTKSGLIEIVENFTITSPNHDTPIIDEWEFTITFIAHTFSQNHNQGKTLNASLIMHEIELNKADVTLTKMGYSASEIEEIKLKQEPDFSQIATTNEGLFSAQDDYGTSYYYRGAVDNNWVEFAGFYWRIIRVNGDGSIRMIYSGTEAPLESEKVVMEGTKTQIGTSAFNVLIDNPVYGGYMYSINEIHGLSNDSTIKTYLDNWYETNILNTKYHNILSDTAVCASRISYHYGTDIVYENIVHTTQIYESRHNINNPKLTCTNKLDSFTVNDIDVGNGALKYPIAIITLEESIMAGGNNITINDNFFLYNNINYWNISISDFYKPNESSSHSGVFVTNATGKISGIGVNGSFGVRPTVNLLSSALVSGTGEWNDPYVVE